MSPGISQRVFENFLAGEQKDPQSHPIFTKVGSLIDLSLLKTSISLKKGQDYFTVNSCTDFLKNYGFKNSRGGEKILACFMYEIVCFRYMWWIFTKFFFVWKQIYRQASKKNRVAGLWSDGFKKSKEGEEKLAIFIQRIVFSDIHYTR